MNHKEPAFPLNELNQSTGDIAAQHFGITTRDYFAAKAMQALIASPFATQDWVRNHGATSAYQMADAMLAERAK